MPNKRRWRQQRPEDYAWKPQPGLDRKQRREEQDRAAGGRLARVVVLDDGRRAAASIALRVQPKGRRIYAYLRWFDRGKTNERYVGEATYDERERNLVQAWALARGRGMVGMTLEREVARSDQRSWAKDAATRAVMQGNRGRDTKPEVALRKAAYALGLRYRVSIRPVPGVRRTADMVFTQAKVAVFLDGCYWHGCPDHHRPATTNAAFWEKKIRTNRERDAETNRLLADSGWRVVRVWEHEDPAEAAHRLAALVK